MAVPTPKRPVPRVRLDRDLRPVSEFRANAASMIERVRTTKRPLVLTQHGRGAVIIVDVQQYESILARLEPLAGSSPASGPVGSDPVEAYKDGIDRSLIRQNLARPASERLRRLAEMGQFAGQLRAAKRRQARPADLRGTGYAEPDTS